MRDKLKSFLIYVLTAVVSFFFGLFILDQVILPQLTGAGRRAEVPVLTGMGEGAALAACQQAGLALEVQGETYSGEMEAGLVLDQDPEAGLTVKQGRGVYVILSRGPEMVTVPHVVGLTQRQAAILIENNFLAVEQVNTTVNASIARGRVVEVDPPPGSVLPKGAALTMVVSQGTQKIRVPSLIDKTVEEARKILTDAGLAIGEVAFRINRYLPPGRVIDQHPLERTPVARDTEVDVVVSSSR